MKFANSSIYQKLTPAMKSIMDGTDQLCLRINYQFKNVNLLLEALTHSSGAQELQRRIGIQIPWNERLEFLGDSILGLVLSTDLLNRPDYFAEGQLSKIRASLVNEDSLANLAERINLGKYLLLSIGEDRSGGRSKKSVLADALEALLGAIYLDSGYDSAQNAILSLYRERLASPLDALVREDFKSRLQEITQGAHKETPNYEVIEQSGPDHNLSFVVAVKFRGSQLALGHGPNKKKASQEAAKIALDRLKTNPKFLTEGIS